MPKYRLLEPVSYVSDGVVVSVDADRLVELTEDQAATLAGRVVLLSNSDSMFPEGQPIIEHTIVRHVPVVSETHVEPAPAAPAKRFK